MTVELIIPILAGWIAGWIVNYLSDVLPVTRRFSKPACPHCDASFSFMDYILFRPCPNGHGRSFRLWLVQAGLTALSVYAFLHPPLKIGYWAGMALLVYFGLVFVIDTEYRLILIPTSIPGSVLALTLGIVSHGFFPTLWGGVAGLLIVLTFYAFGILFTRMRARRMQKQGFEPDDEEAFGQGDITLVTILGLLVGWPLIWFMIVVSILLSGVVSLLFMIGWIVRRQFRANVMMQFIPLGPYYVLGGLLIVFFPEILQALLSN